MGVPTSLTFVRKWYDFLLFNAGVIINFYFGSVDVNNSEVNINPIVIVVTICCTRR